MKKGRKYDRDKGACGTPWDMGQVARRFTEYWENDQGERGLRRYLAGLVARELEPAVRLLRSARAGRSPQAEGLPVPGAVQGLLDAGCGSGTYVPHLLGLGITPDQYLGVDSSRKMLAIARRKHPGWKFRKADLCHLPFQDDSFHVVLCADVIQHVPLADTEQVLGELIRVARKAIVLRAWFTRHDSPHDVRLDGVMWNIWRNQEEFLRQLRTCGDLEIQVLGWEMVVRKSGNRERGRG